MQDSKPTVLLILLLGDHLQIHVAITQSAIAAQTSSTRVRPKYPTACQEALTRYHRGASNSACPKLNLPSAFKAALPSAVGTSIHSHQNQKFENECVFILFWPCSRACGLTRDGTWPPILLLPPAVESKVLPTELLEKSKCESLLIQPLVLSNHLVIFISPP